MKNPQQEYQKQAIKNASPTELVTKLYDFAIRACYNEEKEQLQQVLGALIQSLNFDYEISETLYSLYEYCQRQAEKGEFEEIRELLEPVREAWMNDVVKDNTTPVNRGGKGFVV
ncbi:MAG TPA: flagellar export chaperone FliS [Balneolaceae bacterium]|nr:flagellar export chaperone FliS [Balneolaceae bacterium]